MKPNLVLIQPPHVTADSVVDLFCEAMCETHYVYVLRPSATFCEDSPAGVRFLNLSLDRLPDFGEVESVVVVDGADIAARVQEKYPSAQLCHWSLELDGDFPAAFAPAFSSTVIQGSFGRSADPQLAKAM
jgi:hypothetical protein